MDVESLTITTKNKEEELMGEKSIFWEDLNLPMESFGKIDPLHENYIKPDQENYFSKNCVSEEERLLEERIENKEQNPNQEIKERSCLNLDTGINSHHLIFEDEVLSKEDMFVCKMCLQVFDNSDKLTTHMFHEHNVKKVGRPRKEKTENPRKKYAKENWIPDVQKLARRVGSSKVFVCDRCPYTVARCDSMMKHVLRVHSKGLVKPQFMCEVCGKTFVDRAYLRNHGLTHNQDPQFFCEICGRRFHRQPSLRRHLQGHSQEKQFSCSLCDYQTNRKHLMCKHADNHRLGRAYTCKHCRDKFFTQMSLRRHCYTHHPSRYACSFCKIGFSSRERMWSHMQKIHFACEVTNLKIEDSEDQDEVKVEYIEVKLEPKHS